MSIKATVDGTAYTGIESIVTGGKTIALEEVLSQSGLNWASGVVEKNDNNSLPTMTHNLGTKNIIFVLIATSDTGTVTISRKYETVFTVYFPVTMFYGSGLSLDLSSYNSTASNPFVITGTETNAFCGLNVGTPSENSAALYAPAQTSNAFTIEDNSVTYNMITLVEKFKWYAIDVSVSG